MTSDSPEVWDSQTGPTQTQTPSSLKCSPENPDVWGRLLGIADLLPPIKLKKPIYTLGRAETCDVALTRSYFTIEVLKCVSKVQFKMERCFEEDITNITDLSKNGTYLNGLSIGNNQSLLLQNDDEISITIKDKIKKLYLYKAENNVLQDRLPPVLRQKFLLRSKLGKGTYGQVHLLQDRRTGVKYAVKKILKINFDGKESKRINNEVNILKKLSHPCIIGMKGIEETKSAVYIILEYMQGGELIHRIKETMSARIAKFIFYQIVVGVKYLHSKNITHRDIKPGNILLASFDDEPLVKIADFGLSKIKDGSGLMSTLCGTPYFVAPEILDSKTKYSKQVDVWSLGILLYYMLSNELPFNNPNRNELYVSIRAGKYKMDNDKWKNVSSATKDLIQRMLMVVPTKRITIAEILQHEWITEDSDVIDRAKCLIEKNAIVPAAESGQIDDRSSDRDELFNVAKRPRLQ